MRHAGAKTVRTDDLRGDGPSLNTPEPFALRGPFFQPHLLAAIEYLLSVNITIHRGTRTVGGSCIELASNNMRLILDLGLPLFNADRQPLDSYQLRRMSTDELAKSGILPQVTGLFDDSPSPDAILLTHAHMDHTGLIDRSSADIPVYCTAGTSKVALAGALFANQVAVPRDRFRQLTPEQPVIIGDFTITPYSVDHSVFDCVALLLEAEGKSILYTGDLRLHGRKPGMAKRLIDVLQQQQLDMLVMEGTHFGLADGERVTEYELEDAIVELITASSGLVLASFSPQHVDRLVGFIRAAKKTGRTFVADVYTAFILHLIASQIPVPVPGQDSSLRVFFPELFVASAKRKGLLDKFQGMFDAYRIGVDEIIANPNRHVMVFRPSMLPDFQGKLPPETLCFHSRWEGYRDSPEWRTTEDVLSQNGGKCVQMHTSGHMLSADIVSFVEAIAPRTIVPIHTFEPEEFARRWPNVRLPSDGETIAVD